MRRDNEMTGSILGNIH